MQDEAVAMTVLAPAPELALGSDPHDFAGLYIRHRASLTSHARRYLRDPRDADEVVQEAFLRLFLAMPELESELQALAYARRTITNLCIDRYRADARRPRLVALEGAPVEELAEDDTGDPVVREEDAALVREALSKLPELHRAALVMREIEEKPLPVIADELDVAEDSVKHLLFRARRSLRKLLAGTSVAPGVDAELTRGLRPLSRGASGGLAALLLLALLGSGPDLRAVPVVGVDLPDVLGVTAVADAVGDAVREVVGAIASGNDAHAAPDRQDQPSRPVSRSAQRPATETPTLPAPGGGVPQQPPAAAAVPEDTTRLAPSGAAAAGGTSAGRTSTVDDGRPVVTVAPERGAVPPVQAPTDVAAARPGTSSGRGPEQSRPTSVPPVAPTGGRDVPAQVPSVPTVPVAPPARPSGSEAPGRPARADDAAQKAADKAAEKAADRAAETAQKVEKADDKAAAVAEKAREKAEKAAEQSVKNVEQAAEKAAKAAADRAEDRQAADKVERAAEKAAKAAADRAEDQQAAQQAAQRAAVRAAEQAAAQAAARAAAAAEQAAASGAGAVGTVTAP